MLIIREIFTAKPGQASKLAKLFKEVSQEMAGENVRIMTDVVGNYNTVVMETEVDDFSKFEERMKDYMENSKLREKMSGYTEMYQTGRREIFRVH